MTQLPISWLQHEELYEAYAELTNQYKEILRLHMSFDLGHKNIICLTNIDVEVKFKIFKKQLTTS